MFSGLVNTLVYWWIGVKSFYSDAGIVMGTASVLDHVLFGATVAALLVWPFVGALLAAQALGHPPTRATVIAFAALVAYFAFVITPIAAGIKHAPSNQLPSDEDNPDGVM